MKHFYRLPWSSTVEVPWKQQSQPSKKKEKSYLETSLDISKVPEQNTKWQIIFKACKCLIPITLCGS